MVDDDIKLIFWLNTNTIACFPSFKLHKALFNNELRFKFIRTLHSF